MNTSCFESPPMRPQDLPDLWILKTPDLIRELDRIRQLALMVPLHIDSYAPLNSVVSAVWDLESRLRWLAQADIDRRSKGRG